MGVAALAYMGSLATNSLISMSRDLFGQEMVTVHWRTTAAGVLTVGLALGWASAGIVGGFLIKEFGFWSMFLAGAIFCFFSAGLLIAFLRRRVPVRAIQPS